MKLNFIVFRFLILSFWIWARDILVQLVMVALEKDNLFVWSLVTHGKVEFVWKWFSPIISGDPLLIGIHVVLQIHLSLVHRNAMVV